MTIDQEALLLICTIRITRCVCDLEVVANGIASRGELLIEAGIQLAGVFRGGRLELHTR